MGNTHAAAAVPSVDAARKRFSAVELRLFENGFDRLCKASTVGGLEAIDLVTFRTLLLADFPDLPEALGRRLFAVLDVNKNDALDFGELLCGLCVLARGMVEERLRFLFAVYDVNDAGVLTRRALEQVADVLDDHRFSLDEQFSSRALIEEAFRSAPGGGEAEIAAKSINAGDFARIVTRYMNAPIISWTSNLGQRLLEPLFHVPASAASPPPTPVRRLPATPTATPTATPKRATVAKGSSRLRFSEPAAGPGAAWAPDSGLSPTGQASARAFSSDSLPATASEREPPVLERPPLVRRQSSRSQLREGAHFSQHYAEPSQGRLVPGETWYVISAAWFAVWKSYSGFQCGDLSKLEASKRPGPIDNRDLLRDATLAQVDLAAFEDECEEAQARGEHPFHALRTDLHYGHDFILVPEAAWRVLADAYGGGPVFRREVIRSDLGADHGELELYPITLSVRCVALSCSEGDGGDLGPLLQAEPQMEPPVAGELEIDTEGEAREPKEIVVSKLTSMRELERHILEVCFGERLGRCRASSTSTTGSVASSVDPTAEDQWLASRVPRERLRLWCVLGGSDIDEALVAARGAQHQSAPRVSVHLLQAPLQTVEDANLEDGQTIVLELGGEDGSWPLANANTMKSVRPREQEASLDLSALPPGDGVEGPRLLLLGGGRVGSGRRRNVSVSSGARARRAAKMRYGPGRPVELGPPRRNMQLSPIRAQARVPATMGLANLGNTCFMNAALQCLIHTDLLKQYFLDGSYVLDVNKTNARSTNGMLADAFADLVRTAWTGDGGHSPTFVAPRRFKKEMAKWDKRFTGFEQQDASELLSSLLDGLSEDLNRIRAKAYVELKDSDGRADDVVAREWWENHLRRELNMVTALFTGQFKSLLECGDCAYQSARFEPYMYLSLPLPDSPFRVITVNVIFANNVRPPLVCSVKILKTETFGTLKEAIVALQPGESGVITNAVKNKEDGEEVRHPPVRLSVDRLALAFVYERQIQSIALDGNSLDHLRERDPLFAFQTPDPLASGASARVSDRAPDRIAAGVPEMDEAPALPPRDELREGATVWYKPAPTQLPIRAVVLHNKKRRGWQIRFKTEDEPLRHKPPLSSGETKPFRVIVVKEETLELRDEDPVYARVEQRQWHKHTCYFLNPFRVTNVGQPFVLRLKLDQMTGAELYQLVADQVGVEASVTAEEGRRLRSSESIRRAFGFKVTRVTRPGGTCRMCPWYKSCTGCPILPNDRPLSLDAALKDNCAIAVDWGLASSLKDQSMALGLEVADTHSSVEAMRKEEQREMPLGSLIDAFTGVERLEGNDQVYCAKCKEPKNHTKHIQLWRAPPVVVIHLKRFQHSSWRHRKLVNLVNFPMKDLDLSKYVARSMPAASSKAAMAAKERAPNDAEDEDEEAGPKEQPESPKKEQAKSKKPAATKAKTKAQREAEEEVARLQEEARLEVLDLMDSDATGVRCYGGHEHGGVPPVYDLYGVVNHDGTLGSGHYVASALNSIDNQWYHFDDKSVTKLDESKVVTANAYLLFYVRKDVQNADVGDVFPASKVDARELKQRLKELKVQPTTSMTDRCSIM